MNESSDYSALDLSRLVRHYAALSPSNPRMMASPPFPTDKYLVRTCNQAELFAALSPLDVTPDSAVSLDTKTCRWKYAFWKRIIQVIETTLAEGISPGSEDEGIDEQILLHYISLQRSDQPGTVDIRRYLYGPLDNRSEWKCVTLMEDQASISKGTTGLRSWGASVCLANYLISNPGVLSHQKVVLELGSGTGLVGIVARQLSVGVTVYLTDVDILVLERLNQNVALNKPSTGHSLLVRTLDWEAPTEWTNEKPNLILAADVIYHPSLVLPLARTLRTLLSGPVKSTALLAATVREPRTWAQFLSCCNSECMEVRSLPVPSGDDDGIPAVDGLDQHAHSQIQMIELSLANLTV